MFDQADLCIGKIRSPSSGADNAVLRMAVSSFVQRADLHPPELPSSEILVIRQVSDPLPGSVPGQSQGRLRHARWESAVRDRIGACYRSAQRPTQGNINANTDAVLFADQGELLACLSLDICGNRVDERWWWREIIRQFARQNVNSNRLGEIWKQYIEAVPATISYLLQWSNAASVVSGLDRSEIIGLIASLAQVHSLDLLLSESNKSEHEPQTQIAAELSNEELSSAPGGQQAGLGPEAAGNPTLVSFWGEQLADLPLPANLSSDQLRLLLLGAVLQRSPWRAGHRQWQRKLLRAAPAGTGYWDHGEVSGRQSQSLDEFPTANDSLPESASKTEPRQAPSLYVVPQDNAAVDESMSVIDDDKQVNMDGREPGQPVDVHGRGAGLSSSTDPGDKNFSQREKIDQPVLVPLHETGSNETDEFDRSHALPRDVAPVGGNIDVNTRQGTTTDLGGALYLLNLCSWLDIPDCFVKTWPDAALPSAWSVIEALARMLLLDAGREYEDDALWPLLAELDGREPGMLMGYGMIFPEQVVLPRNWFDILKKTVEPAHFHVRFSVTENRLLLWCDDFLLGAEPLRAEIDVEVQAHALLGRFPFLDTADLHRAPLPESFDLISAATLTTSTTADYAEWFYGLFPFMRFVLMRQYGFDDPAELSALLHCRGRVQLTRTHLDFHASMETVSLPVREAGLDQDPGWCPLVGRVVQFHFH